MVAFHLDLNVGAWAMRGDGARCEKKMCNLLLKFVRDFTVADDASGAEGGSLYTK